MKTSSRTTESAGVPGAFEGETVTRRRLMSGTAMLARAVATAAAALPGIGFAIAPVFRRLPVLWQPVGAVDSFPRTHTGRS